MTVVPNRKLQRFWNGVVVAAEVGDERLCSEVGIDEVSSCRIVWELVAAEVPVAELTAADWAAVPAGLVVAAGEANGVTWVAAADWPA
jgi:hypothetical protein